MTPKIVQVFLLFLLGTTDHRLAAASSSSCSDSSSDSSDEIIDASGDFIVDINPLTFTFTPNGIDKCDITVDGTITFEGTIEGTATGTTRATIFGTCEEFLSTQPGDLDDEFEADLEFTGFVGCTPVTADVTYSGTTTAPGGQIDAKFIFTGDIVGESDVNAILGVGGTYEGEISKA